MYLCLVFKSYFSRRVSFLKTVSEVLSMDDGECYKLNIKS